MRLTQARGTHSQCATCRRGFPPPQHHILLFLLHCIWRPRSDQNLGTLDEHLQRSLVSVAGCRGRLTLTGNVTNKLTQILTCEPTTAAPTRQLPRGHLRTLPPYLSTTAICVKPNPEPESLLNFKYCEKRWLEWAAPTPGNRHFQGQNYLLTCIDSGLQGLTKPISKLTWRFIYVITSDMCSRALEPL